jgi:wyosine [tRNA(Phe)-imidazoG37] synthetase (radical SAM superfamily)
LNQKLKSEVFMKSNWQGDPIWPEELSSAVAERLVQCKEQLTDFAVELVIGGLLRRHPSLELDDCLGLTEKFLGVLPPHQVEQSLQIAAGAEADIVELLTDEQRRELSEIGFRSLLARLDYSGEANFMRKLNGLPIATDATREDYSEYFCEKPFEFADIGTKGKVTLCCALWLPEVAGDYSSGTFMEVWNSERAQAIRGSILDGSYSHCLEQHCPHLQNKTLLKRDEVTDPVHLDIIENNRTVLEHGPKSVVLSYDKSCNLACRTCRVEPIMLTGEDRSEAERIQDWATGEHLKDCRELNVTLSGDAFGSPVFFTFLREFDASLYPELRITLCTNGIGLTERNWGRICNEAVDVVYVSVDAATVETYAVNRGGNWKKLLENLRFVGTLMSKGDVKGFTLSFVVQANNYHELPAFAALGESVNASSVMFIQIGNTGVFTKEEYEERAIHLPSHPEHQQLLEVLKDPILGLSIVDLRNFDGLREQPEGVKAPGPPPSQASLVKAVEVIRTHSKDLAEVGIDGTAVVDAGRLSNSKAQIRSALDVVIAGAATEEERASLASIRQALAFFQPGVAEETATLDAIAFEEQTWGSIVRAEMAEHAQ